MMWFAILFSFFGCDTEEKVQEDTVITETDVDGDGFIASEDCDDNNPEINSSAIEICDGQDNNCDGQIDEGVTTTFYVDADGDGFGDSDNTAEACSEPEGYVLTANDCNDQNAEIYPGSEKQCDETHTTFCASGGEVQGASVSGVFCFAPVDLGAAPVATNENLTWQPGPFTQITKQ